MCAHAKQQKREKRGCGDFAESFSSVQQTPQFCRSCPFREAGCLKERTYTALMFAGQPWSEVYSASANAATRDKRASYPPTGTLESHSKSSVHTVPALVEEFGRTFYLMRVCFNDILPPPPIDVRSTADKRQPLQVLQPARCEPNWQRPRDCRAWTIQSETRVYSYRL